MKDERLKPEDCWEEIKELLDDKLAPIAAILEMSQVHDRFERGGITASEAMSIAQRHANRFPAVPVLFLYCSFFAHELGRDLDSLGYAALYCLKSERTQGLLDFRRHQEWQAQFRPFFEKLESDETALSVWAYFDEGDEHLVNHFFVQDITDGVVHTEEKWQYAVCERLGEIAPLLISMIEDQFRLHLITSCEAPAGLPTMIALVGCSRSRDAIPALLDALVYCTSDPLNEAIIALAKIGSSYPSEVSSELREFIRSTESGEARLAAVDALGILWEAPGNLEFLQRMLAGWRPDERGDNHLFRFLVHALLSSREPAAEAAVLSALEACREELDADSVSFAEDYLKHYQEIRLGPRIMDILAEKPEDFLSPPTSDLFRERRSTLTLQRADDLEKKEAEAMLENGLDAVEALLKRGRNELCGCGSGLKFKKCCLPRLEEMRERMKRGEVVKPGKTTYAMLLEELERYSKLPSVRAEREEALFEYLNPLGRTRFEGNIIYGGVSEEAFFEEWFMLSKPLKRSGKTVAQEMLEMNVPAFDSTARALLRGLASSRFSVYEVWEVIPGEEVQLRDIFRGEDMRVRERTASRQLVKWDLVVTRVGNVEDHKEMMGITLLVPRHYLEPLESFVKRTSKEFVRKKLANGVDDFLQRYGHLVFHQIMHLYMSEPRPVAITAEGDEFMLCTATFDVSDVDAVLHMLREHPYMLDEGIEGGRRRFSWFLSREMENELRKGEHVGPQDKSRTFSISPKTLTEGQANSERELGNVMRSLGTLEIQGKRLNFHTNSLPRLEAGKRELQDLLAGVAIHRADSIEDQEALLGEAWRKRGRMPGYEAPQTHAIGQRGGESMPKELMEEAFRELAERVYDNWLDEPQPYLGGKTPREAAKTAKGRRLVNRLLQEYENKAERDRMAGKPVYDFSRFRRELDVWPERTRPPDLLFR